MGGGTPAGPAAPGGAPPAAGARTGPPAAVTQFGGPAAHPKIDWTKNGEEFISQLPPALASQIKGIAEGRQQIGGRQATSPAGRQLLALVNQYDPSFDMVNY